MIADAPPLGVRRGGGPRRPVRRRVELHVGLDLQGYGGQLRSAPDLIHPIQSAYRQAAAAWRLPLHGGFETFNQSSTSRSSRGARRSRATDVRRRLGLPGDTRLALASFGGYGLKGLDPATARLHATAGTSS